MKNALFIVAVLLSLLVLLSSCGGGAVPVTTSIATVVTTTTSAAPTTSSPSLTTVPATTLPTKTAGQDFLYASAMADFFYNINAVHNYYGDGLTAMSTFGVGTNNLVVSDTRYHVVFAAASEGPGVMPAIPPEMSEDLPADGAMPAPPGACPAAAEPYENFVTENGDVVTPDLLKEKDVVTLPVSMVNAPSSDPDSLYSIMQQLVPSGDMRLGTAEGWNALLWDKLRAMQAPATSLMDYQMWTLSDDLETEVIANFRQTLADQGVPDRVLDAFDQSANTGWYAKHPPTPGDALAMMDIKATLTGSVSGVVHEWRDFTIPSLGSSPVFGEQHGDGTVTMNIPDVGPMDCTVDILFTDFDELGRATEGTVTATPVGIDGYKIIFTYKPDGSKEGVVYDPDGNEVGYLTMTTDPDKFTNYVNVKEGTELKLPDVVPAPTTTVIQ